MEFRFHYIRRGDEWLPPVLMLHGFMGNHADWDEICDRLKGRYHLIVPDLPGHGRTEIHPAGSPVDMSSLAQALIRLLRDLVGRRTCLVGYSMGGRLALYLAVHYPAGFRKVLLESASPGLRDEQERLYRHRLDMERAAAIETGFEEFLEQWYRQPLFDSLRRHPEFEAVYRMRLRQNPAGLAQTLRSLSIGVQQPMWEALSQLEIPVRIMAGEKDPKYVAIAGEMSAVSPRISRSVVKGCGHNIHFENPDRFTDCLREFFDEI